MILARNYLTMITIIKNYNLLVHPINHGIETIHNFMTHSVAKILKVTLVMIYNYMIISVGAIFYYLL